MMDLIPHPDTVKEKAVAFYKSHKMLAWIVAIIMAAIFLLGILANIFGVFGIPKSSPETTMDSLDEEISKLEQLCLGKSKKWVLEQFGTPDFEDSSNIPYGLEEETEPCEEYLYIAKDKSYAMRAFFVDDKLVAFFTTITGENALGKIHIPLPYSYYFEVFNDLNKKALGDFSYYDIFYRPSSYSPSPNGIQASPKERCYSEYLHLMRPFYYDVSFWNAQYGLDLNPNNDEDAFWSDEQLLIDGEFPIDLLSYFFWDWDESDSEPKEFYQSIAGLGGDRKINKPNTYGFSEYPISYFGERIEWQWLGEIQSILGN